MKKIDLDDEFADMMRRVWPRVPAASAQYLESRKLWFVTIHWMLCTMLQLAKLSDEEAEESLEHIKDQVDEFRKEMKVNHKEDFDEH